jgi:hypothetical protein
MQRIRTIKALDYLFANRDGRSIHLALDPDRDPGSTYLSVRDADALYEEWSASGIGGVTGPVGPTEYGLREGSHIDRAGTSSGSGHPTRQRTTQAGARAGPVRFGYPRSRR